MDARRIAAEEVIPIRWEILRPGFPRETAIFPGDEDTDTRHFGVFHEGKLVGVASIYRAPFPGEDGPAMQLRGMATLPEVRGLGGGRVLLEACVASAAESGCPLLWCNARRIATDFYSRHDWEIVGEEFEIPSVGPHFRMVRRVAPAGQVH